MRAFKNILVLISIVLVLLSLVLVHPPLVPEWLQIPALVGVVLGLALPPHGKNRDKVQSPRDD